MTPLATIGTGPDDWYSPHFLLYRKGERAVVTDPLEDIGVRAARAIQSALTNAGLTEAGKREHVESIQRKALAEIDELEATALRSLIQSRDLAEGMLARAQRLRLPENVTPEDSRVQAAEIRAEALKRNPDERKKMYMDACSRDDVVAVRAFEDASEALELLPDRSKTLAEGAELHGASYAPKSFLELVERRSVVESVEDDLARIRHELGAIPTVSEVMAR